MLRFMAWLCVRNDDCKDSQMVIVTGPGVSGPNTDIHGNITGEKRPIVSIVEDKKEPSSSYSNPKLPRSFQEMERHGLKITSYTTTEVDK
jgi:hypothetical protein